MQKAKKMNKICIMEQTIAPKIYESELLLSEYEKYGSWVDENVKIHKNIEFENREREEWKLADFIICGSDFVKDLLIDYGVEKARCLVIPSGVKINAFKNDKLLYNGRRKLRVLTVGTVNLRKGIQYTYQASKKLEHIAEFRCVGKVELNDTAKHDISKYIDLVGEIPRSEISEHYKWADVFLLPSLCEGSALSVYEALSFQLPVICTYSTGSIIKNGIGGIIIPSHDVLAIVDSITSLSNVDKYIALHSGISDIVEGASFESYQARWSEHMVRILKKVER
ncbi:TPA: glycosyltransferase family 4 protein [Vibrio cholerae]|nr:glycosyltransferase family 4 protein [Vibrio cholerae]